MSGELDREGLEAAARALTRKTILERRRHDTDPDKLASMIDQAVDMHWRDAIPDAEAAISAYLAATGSSGWRDIETAPKDGSALLIYPAFRKGAGIAVWDSSLKYWRLRLDGDRIRVNATHWQPLPSPPGEAG